MLQLPEEFHLLEEFLQKQALKNFIFYIVVYNIFFLLYASRIYYKRLEIDFMKRLACTRKDEELTRRLCEICDEKMRRTFLSCISNFILEVFVYPLAAILTACEASRIFIECLPFQEICRPFCEQDPSRSMLKATIALLFFLIFQLLLFLVDYCAHDMQFNYKFDTFKCFGSTIWAQSYVREILSESIGRSTFWNICLFFVGYPLAFLASYIVSEEIPFQDLCRPFCKL